MPVGIQMASTRTYDTLLELKTAGLVAADTAHTIVDLGDGAVINGEVQIDWSACEIASSDEHYQVGVYLSNSATFASGVVLQGITWFGKASPINTLCGNITGAVNDTDTAATGRRIVPFTNVVDGTTYRYVRLATNVTGTIATGMNFAARIALPA